ncbi:winged helix-turn-helix domain-containing protein [Dokdonella sp.]|uniref:winged helix-turn-helix domain-containing protein n=1 Tax=Dokdonella sp. TaxID=2291710 RepID=UPI001AFE1EBF|nr:winged helix-turn-helix domain-containing protein [Dokdonella sp.]MBO9662518.1 winged helix-turn-helix domain-containing protein [Dokdonella sp.]
MRNRLYRFGKFQLTNGARELRREGERVPLARRAFDCLLYLIEHRDRAVGRDELTAAVWGRVDVTDAQLSQVMLQARRAIDDSGQAQSAVRTLPGFGYRWIAETDERSDDGGPAEAASAAVADEPPAPEPETEAAPTGTAVWTFEAPAAAARRAPAPRRRFAAAAAIAALAVALAAVAWLSHRSPNADPVAEASAEPSSFAVLPLDVNGPKDSSWIRLGAMDLIAERLRDAGLAVPPSENVLIALRGAPADDGGTPRLRGNLGVGSLVEGKAMRSPEGWTVELAATRGDAQRYTATAKHVDVIRAARQAADLLLAAMGHSPPAERGENDDLDERLQQAQAAMLASELDTARKILAAIPEQDAPRARLMLAMVDARAGRLDQADAGYTRLVADPSVRADPVLYGRALSNRALARVRLERYADAESDYDAAVGALQNANSPIDLARALNGRGGVRVGLDRFDEAATDLGRARIELQRNGDRLGLIQSDTNLGLLEYQRERYEPALKSLLGAADQFEAFGAPERMLGVLTVAFDADAALWRWPEALAIADRQWAHRDRAGDPGLALKIAVNRGEALVMLGRLREARELAAQAQREHANTRPQARRYLDALLATIAWSAGDARQAATAAERGLALWSPDDPDVERNGAQLILLHQRALIAAGEASVDTMERELSPGTRNPSPFLLIARAERSAWTGKPTDAENHFRAALKQAEARGTPIGLVTVGVAYGRWLLAQRRVEEAGALAGRLAPWSDRDFDVALFEAAVFDARGDRRESDAALQRARALAGEREVPSGSRTVASK